MPGPVPNRSDQRRRRNTEGGEISRAPAGERVEAPEADPDWHPLARDFFESLGKSGQAVYYQASDWMYARYVAEAMSRNLRGTEKGGFSAMLFASVVSAMGELLVTEGDRRRMKVELERHAAVDVDEERASATVTDLRARLGG